MFQKKDEQMKKLFLTALFSVLLVGCAGTNFNWDNARQIKQGMNEKEAVALMGYSKVQ